MSAPITLFLIDDHPLLRRGLVALLSQHPDLRALLLGTGDQVLVEASPVDSVWGIGLAEDHPHASQPLLWPGENGLGFALMKVRQQLIGNGAAANE